MAESLPPIFSRPYARPRGSAMDHKKIVTREEILVTLMLVLTSLALVAFG